MNFDRIGHIAVVFPLLLGALMPIAGGAQASAPPPADTGLKWEKSVKVFPLFHADHEDVAAVASEFLSTDGTLTYMKKRNAIVVIDYPANIKAINKIIEALEGTEPPANIRIKVAFSETGQKAAGGWEIDPGLPVVIEDGEVKNQEIDIRVGKRDVAQTSQTVQQILTRDGREAQLWVGETVQEPMWVFEYGRRHGWWQTEWAEYKFGASLWVKPRLLGNGTIEIDVYPRITSRTGQRLSVDVKELTVSVLAQHGQTITIGGMDSAKREAYRKILGRGKVFDGNSLTINLTPYVEKVSAAPPPPGTVRQPVTPIQVERTYKRMP